MKLTSGERLLVSRRRLGVSQATHAKKLRVTLYTYRAMEASKAARGGPTIGRLAVHERCFLLRRRHAVPLKALAKTLGISSNWLCDLEHGRQDVAPLARHWRLSRKTG